jgi:uncharacterized protein YbcI
MSNANVFNELESNYQDELGKLPESVKESIQSNLGILDLIGNILGLFSDALIKSFGDLTVQNADVEDAESELNK